MDEQEETQMLLVVPTFYDALSCGPDFPNRVSSLKVSFAAVAQ